MNKIERLIYDAVKTNPWIKNTIRNLYQGVFDLLPRKSNVLPNSASLKEGFFFGFHDISPFSNDMTKVLANKPDVFKRMPKEDDVLKVGFFDFIEGKLADFSEIGESSSWNHHKGCRLQWLSESSIIYNTYNGHQLIAEIVNINDKQKKNISFPIDAVSKDGTFATNFSYQRLETLMPGYGYLNKTDDALLEENAPENTGLFLVNIPQNSRKQLVSLFELAQHIGGHDILSYRHYVTHSEFSDDGRYISFLHRWVGEDVMKRWSRLVVYDLVTNNILAAPTDGMVSHYVWNKRNQILAYCSIDGADGHVLFNVPSMSNFKFIAKHALNSDGHQSFVSDDEFVTDTYPDKFRMSKIFKVNISSEEIRSIASVYSPKSYQSKLPYKHIACDLHPRVSVDSQYVCFDTAMTGVRSICVIPLNG